MPIKAFDEYMEALEDTNSSADSLNIALQHYKTTRKAKTNDILKKVVKKWRDVLKEDDTRNIWCYVNWKAELKNKKQLKSPSLEEFEVFFEELYKC